MTGRRERSDVPVVCTHKRRHEHGTIGAYSKDKCGCEPCRLANKRFSAQWRYSRAKNPDYSYAPIGPVRDHLEVLFRLGMTRQSIATQTGLSPDTLKKIQRPERTRVQVRVRRLILSIPADPAQLPGMVDAGASRRRLRALALLEWACSALAPYTPEVSEATLQDIVNGERRRVLTTTHATIAAAYDLLTAPDGPTPPKGDRYERRTATLARNHALALDWRPHTWWDDVDTGTAWTDEDDQAEELFVDEAVVLQRIAGKRPPANLAEQWEVVSRMLADGATQAHIERTTGLNVKRVSANWRTRQAELAKDAGDAGEAQAS